MLKYNSPCIRNDLISCTGEWIRNQIVREVKHFSVCADKAADSSNKEQLPLVLCFVDTTNSVHEEFVEFIHCDTGTSGDTVAGKVLEEYGLNVNYLRGQGFKGAWLESTEVLLL